MPADTTPVWKIYNIPQPTYSNTYQPLPAAQQQAPSIGNMQQQSQSNPQQDLSQIGKVANGLGSAFGSQGLQSFGQAATNLSQGIGSSLINSASPMLNSILPIIF